MRATCIKKTCIKNMKALKYQLLIPLLVFIAGIAALAHLTCTTYTYSNERVRTLAKLNAVTYSDQIIRQLNEGINVTRYTGAACHQLRRKYR